MEPSTSIICRVCWFLLMVDCSLECVEIMVWETVFDRALSSRNPCGLVEGMTLKRDFPLLLPHFFTV